MVGEVGVDLHARFTAIPGVDLGGARALPAGADELPIGLRSRAVIPVTRERQFVMCVDDRGKRGPVVLSREVPIVGPSELA